MTGAVVYHRRCIGGRCFGACYHGVPPTRPSLLCLDAGAGGVLAVCTDLRTTPA